jgi:hypothetical protein
LKIYIFWALILQWALIYAFITKKKEEIKIIHSFYRYELKINIRKCSQKLTTCRGAYIAVLAWIQIQCFLMFLNRWEICRRWPKNRGQKQSSLHLHSKQSRKLARSCFSWRFFAFHSTIHKLTVILLKVDHEFFVLGWFVL